MLTLLTLLTPASASDDCSLWEIANGVACDQDLDFTHLSTTPGGSGTLTGRWVPECEDGGSDCEGDEIRCIDGTRPAYHIEPSPPNSQNPDTWVIYFKGGGSCGEQWSYDPVTGQATLDADAWVTCSDAYNATDGDDDENGTDGSFIDRKEMSSDGVAQLKKGKGILSPEPENPFSDANRISVYKCSFDRFAGLDTHEGIGDGSNVLYFHGRRIARAVFADLASRDGMGDGQNDKVLLAGNSGGSGGLLLTVDEHAELLTTVHGVEEVAVLLDGRLSPSVHNEAVFDLTNPAASLYDEIGQGTSDIGTFSTSTFRTFPSGSGPTRGLFETWFGSQGTGGIDASCDANTTVGTRWRCFDEQYLLANEIQTRMYLSHSIEDSNQSNNPIAWMNGEHLWTVPTYRPRVMAQADDIQANGPHVGLGMWSLDYTRHVQVLNDQHWGVPSSAGPAGGLCHKPTSTVLTLGEAVYDWFENGTSIWSNEKSGAITNTWDNGGCP